MSSEGIRAPRSSAGTAALGSAGIVAIVAGVLVVIALLWTASEMHYRACVEKAEAKFPAVPVSAFTGKQTGPLKVSFVSERGKAVDDCGHF
jgi:hypothetical protein